RVLDGWVGELAVTIHRGIEVTGIAQDDTGVEVELSDGDKLRAEYVVGCDGGRSLIRKSAGIAFPGWDPTVSNLIAEVEVAGEPKWGIHRNAFGVHGFGKLKYEIRDGEVVYMDGGPARVMVTERQVGPAGEPTLRETVSELLGIDEPRKRVAAMMSGLGIHYDLGEGHKLLGRRMPDLDLVTANGPLRVFTLLHEARPVLLNLGESGGLDITPWA